MKKIRYPLSECLESMSLLSKEKVLYYQRSSFKSDEFQQMRVISNNIFFWVSLLKCYKTIIYLF